MDRLIENSNRWLAPASKIISDRVVNRRQQGRVTVAMFAIGLLALGYNARVEAALAQGSIDACIEDEMPASGVPGLAYAVVVDGEIQQIGARGVVKLGGATPVTGDTPFLIGSVSKSFTALALMQLVELEKLDLDAALSSYLECFVGRPSAAITIRQLLSHTSGFSTLQGNLSHVDKTAKKDELARSVDELARLDPAYPAGSRWEYSNANYQILGRVIEVVSGQEFQSYVESKILEPIGMKHSFVSDGEVHAEMASAHLPWFGSKRALPPSETVRSVAPQGGVVASAHDLALYMRVMMNGKDDILSAAGKAAMMRPASEMSPFYGLGWFLDVEHATVWHAGTSPGFETILTMIPARRKGVVVLFNSGSGVGFAEGTQLANCVTARAIGLDYEEQGSRWPQKALFIGLTLAPFSFLISMFWAWRARQALRAKTKNAFGRFSLWLPLATTLGGAAIIFGLVPGFFGVPLTTLQLFAPDLTLLMISSAVCGVLWAVFRLGVAYRKSR